MAQCDRGLTTVVLLELYHCTIKITPTAWLDALCLHVEFVEYRRLAQSDRGLTTVVLLELYHCTIKIS